MFMRILMRAGLVLMLSSLTACSFLNTIPTPTAAEIEKEEQAVYASFFGEGPGTVLILQNTSSEISSDNPEQSIDYIKSGLQGISKDTLDNFLVRNAQPGPLSADMQLGIDYILISPDELAQITRQPDWGNVLHAKYPNSNGYTMLSRVGFNNTLDQALVYVGSMAGPLMGAGFYYLLEKENGEWVVRQQVMVWIS